MRLTNVVWRQHLGRWMKLRWKLQAKREIKQSTIKQDLASLGIRVVDINDVVKDVGKIKVECESLIIPQMEDPPETFNENHPLYKTTPAFVHKNNTVLVEGLDQAQIISKSVKLDQKFPQCLEQKIAEIDTNELDKIVQNCIFASHVFDAQQEKLPIVRDPERPAWVFPRTLGITQRRRCYLICEKLLQICLAQRSRHLPLFTVNSSNCVVPIDKDGDHFQFHLTYDRALLSSVPVKKMSLSEEDVKANEISLPSIFPIKHTITLKKSNFYDLRTVHPVSDVSKYHHLHTLIIQENESELRNLYDTPVKESQILGRCVLFGFAAAVLQARRMFGEEVKELPFPVVVQCIQTNGRLFDFCVFQLNTMDLNGSEGNKNMFWLSPREELFSSCGYLEGRPSLKDYNPHVFKNLLAFCSQ